MLGSQYLRHKDILMNKTDKNPCGRRAFTLMGGGSHNLEVIPLKIRSFLVFFKKKCYYYNWATLSASGPF